MSELNDWDIVDGNNNDPVPDGWPENMNYSEVNNTGRAVQGTVKRFFADIGGSLLTTGTANTYAVTLNAGYTALFDGLFFRAGINISNTGASTINVNGIGATALQDRDGNALVAGDLQADSIYDFHYNGVTFRVLNISKQVAGSDVVTTAGGQSIAGTTTINDLNVTTNVDAATLVTTGLATLNSLNLGGTLVTATAAELNILDGVTSTTAELNILDGVTATTAELNILDGVTATTAELNVLDGYTGSVTELNYLDTLHATGVTATEFDYLDGVTSNIQTQLNSKEGAITLTANRAVISDASGIVTASAVTSTELGYLDGVTSNVQTQLNAKQATITGAATTIDDANLTASRALVSDVSGKVAVSAVTSTELGYLDGVTSNIQTQINGIDSGIPASGGTFTGDVTFQDNVDINFGTGSDASMRFNSATNELQINLANGVDFLMDGVNTTHKITLGGFCDVYGDSTLYNRESIYAGRTGPSTYASGYFSLYWSSGNINSEGVITNPPISTAQVCRFNYASDTQMAVEGDGDMFIDGTLSENQADYAEMFEWTDGNPSDQDRAGMSVVLEGDQIRVATIDDDPSSIIGVISGHPCVVGDAGANHWSNKWATDEFGRRLKRMEDFYIVEEKGEEVPYKITRWHGDMGHENPPENIIRIDQYPEPYYNPDYNPDAEYVPRKDRIEWDAVGMLGKLVLRKGQPVNSNWIKLEDVNENLERWLVR